MNKALLPLLLCCFIFPASGKDAGWQWYNEKINPKEKENKPVPAAPRQEPDIMQKLAALQTATKRALYEAILYPGVDNFVKYFRLQNYWTQQAGLFTMSAKKAMLAHPELDLTCSTAITTARYGTSWRQTRRSSDRPLRNWLNTTASCSFTGGRTPSTGNWRRSLMASGIPMV
ncbi:conjugal pilus assembly protein TraF [Escherichia coli]|uniref:Conjugal pilus assembly protein TraF n=1 Tax=Escherichia coli TaxID=562 RepID=A0AAX2KNU4_ECOLX|nr:conjugal pilus assembly protein TraF [Escherichia coli]